MEYGRKTLILSLAMAIMTITAAFAHQAAATGPRPSPEAVPGRPGVDGSPSITAPGCILTFSATSVSPVAAGTDRDVMRAWAIVTGSIHRKSARMPATTFRCPAVPSPTHAARSSATSGRASPPGEAGDEGLKTGLRYHFGPKATR